MRQICYLSITLVAVAMPCVSAFPKPDEDSKPGKVELFLVSPAKAIFTGDVFPLKFLWKNGDSRAVTLLRPLDGSECGWRKVSYTWEVTRDGKPVQRGGYGRCGNVNLLTEADFFTLLPGKSSEIEPGFAGPAETFFPLKDPGVYTIRMVYRFDPKGREKGEGSLGNGLLKQKFDAMPLQEFTSNSIMVEVKTLPPALKAAKVKVVEAEELSLTACNHHNKLTNERTGTAEHEDAIRKAKIVFDVAERRANELRAEFVRFRKEFDPSK